MCIKCAGGRPIRVFVNVGGPSVDLGGEEDARAIPSGLIFRPLPFRQGNKEGLISVMLKRGVPVIHLLNVNRLAVRNGLQVR
jgi:poly-gamma-glutamate system protein